MNGGFLTARNTFEGIIPSCVPGFFFDHQKRLRCSMSITRTLPLALLCTIVLSSCAQITYNITVTGERNTITATGAVDKTTDDLMDMAGSAYGDATSNEGQTR